MAIGRPAAPDSGGLGMLDAPPAGDPASAPRGGRRIKAMSSNTALIPCMDRR
jgi:hypothetical protein